MEKTDDLKIPMGSCFADGFVNKKKRERTSRESTPPLVKKQAKMNDEESETSPSSSDDASRRDRKPSVGILMASGDRRVKYASHGMVSVIGRRRAMEDAVAVAVDGEIDSYEFFAVYDGHGGVHAANMCRDRLHLIISKEVEERRKTSRRCGGGGGEGGFEFWGEVMAASFEKMDGEVSSGEAEWAETVKSVGSTAVVVMVGEEELVVANCGDSRAVLYRGGVALPLTRDHKPDRPDEKERVEAAGGRVIDWNGSRVLGVLATSRSIGDQYLKPYVISEPEVTARERTESDDFIIIATDGLWDVVSNEFACEVVRRYLNGQLKMRARKEVSGAEGAALLLAELAMARGSRDNISVLVVELKRYSTSSTTTS
ncbi:hypothetical protein ACOSQ3_025148 [Xanthoceras sorbifolium]